MRSLIEFRCNSKVLARMGVACLSRPLALKRSETPHVVSYNQYGAIGCAGSV